jgi:hypothetical protein
LTKSSKDKEETLGISGREFDTPLYVDGEVSDEPEMYLGEKPYELSKYEFSVLRKKKASSKFWFQLICGATAGFILSVVGKILHSLILKVDPKLELWEICAILVGIIAAVFLKNKKTTETVEAEKIEQYIEQHYISNPKRRIHIAGKGGSNNED